MSPNMTANRKGKVMMEKRAGLASRYRAMPAVMGRQGRGGQGWVAHEQQGWAGRDALASAGRASS